MSRLAVLVSFTLKPGAHDRFLAHVKENAATSVGEEPGCLRFDILTSAKADSVLLYEIYSDAAAFDQHLMTPHFRSFDTATRDLVETKTVCRYAAIENDKAIARAAL